jgi:hypothetical protein
MLNEIFVWYIGGLMMTGQKRSTRVEEPAPIPFCQSQIPHGLDDSATPAKAYIALNWSLGN